jgi:fumarate reductase flavoprotein subunit
MSIGSITAAGTALQARAGIQDSVDAHYADLLNGIEAAARGREIYDRDLSRLMCEVAPKAIERLTELGLRFSGPHPEPPNSVYRMHNVVPDSSAYVRVLESAAKARGAEIRIGTGVAALHRSENGTVIGMTASGADGTTREIGATRAVILAAGDFSANDDLARAYGRPPEISAIDPLRPYATGDGLVAATAIGAATVAMHRSGGANFRTTVPPYCSPDRGLIVAGGVLVNREGRRFTNELRSAALATNHQLRKEAYLVFDAGVAAAIATADEDAEFSRDGWFRNAKLQATTFPGVGYAYLDDLRATSYFFEARSLGELAAKTGLPPAPLIEDIQALNAIEPGATDTFGRERSGGGVAVAPFYAIGPIKPVNVFSGGGLAVDREMRVLDSERRPIPGLYACGANAEAGVYLDGHGHHLAWAFGTGQIAGRNAAREA